jgi:3-isopropylmalate/(R)-2-methylmalate dehydratase large subunit
VAYWKTLKSDPDAIFLIPNIDAADIEPMITYGTNLEWELVFLKVSRMPVRFKVVQKPIKSLAYMGFEEDDVMIGKPIDFVFLGSCTNGRIEDFRAFTEIVKDVKKAANVTAWLVPGSHVVEAQIKEEGLLDVLIEAGFVLRQPDVRLVSDERR